jgi:predicted RNA-binding Zn-ribbon protein involved in translation (DUF1610 family)
MNTIDNHITKNYSDGLNIACLKCGWEGHEDNCVIAENPHIVVEESVDYYALYCPNCGEEV